VVTKSGIVAPDDPIGIVRPAGPQEPLQPV
jgi:hypothetical protein